MFVDEEVQQELDQAEAAIAEPEIVAVPRVKKSKPIIRERKRRAKKGMEIRSKKVIREEFQNKWDGGNFVIHFPEELEEKYAEELAAIAGLHKPAYGARIPYNPDGTIPEDKLTFLSVYKVRIADESLQAIAKFGKSNRFDFDSDIAVRAQMATADGKELEKLSYAKSNAELTLPKYKLIDRSTKKPLSFRPFQKAGIAYALQAKRTFIADEMGLGKTIEGVGVIVCDQENQCREGLQQPWLVITPASLRINWYKELRKWLPKKIPITMIKNKFITSRTVKAKNIGGEARVVLTKATKAYLAEHQVFVMTYDKIHRYGDALKGITWRGIIFDESHYLKGRGTQRMVACRNFVDAVDPEFILLLSGTPLMNRPLDLLSQLRILNRLNDFGGYNHFLTRYCTMSTTDTTHVSAVHKASQVGVVDEASETNDNTETVDLTQMNTAISSTIDILQSAKDDATRKLYANMIALNKSLRSLCYVRREKSDVLKDLPEKTRQTLTFDITNRRDYEAIEADVIGYLMDKVSKDKKFLSSIKKFSKAKQAALITERKASKAVRSARAEALVRIENLKQCAATGKLGAVKEWIEDFLESGKKLVVFATHNIILNELEAMFPNAISIRSNMSPERRDEAVTTFQTNKKKNLILVGLKLALGLTLTAASDTLTVEFGWTPAVHDQAEDRVHRIGQREAVVAYYAVAQATIEEKIGRLIERKRRVVNAVADGDPLKDAGVGSVLGDLLGELTGGLHLYD
jgi:SWI/SNF-related matrix-associated actin-dependent regulator 1 of chromatin subfamily A